MQEMGSSKRRAEEVALLLHQVSLPAARRDYELRSSSPAPRAATSSSQLVSRAFQNARATSFNATAHCEDVPVVLYNQRVFFSGPLSSHGVAHPVAVRAPAAPTREPKTVVDSDSAVLSSAHAHDFPGGRGHGRIDRALSAGPVFDEPSTRSTTNTAHPPRRAFSGDLRAPKPSNRVNTNRPRSSELARELMRASSSRWSREDAQARSCDVVTRAGDVTRAAGAATGACDATRACEAEEKKRGESRRRPTASIAWDSLNESQPNSPQHELAAIPFQWEEAPGKPLAMRVRENSQQPTTRLATLVSRAEAPSPRAEVEVEVRAHSHRFYSTSATQCEQPTRKSSFDAASAHLISEVVSSIDLVAPAAAKFLVESWVSPAAAPEAHVAVPFQWEESPGVPLKLDAEEEGVCTDAKAVVALQLPPRLASPALAPPTASKDEVRGRLRKRSMSGPLAGYYPHASPAQRRQLQQSPVTHRRSCSPSKRSMSPSRIQAIAQHFTSSQRKREGHGALMASLEADLRDSAGSYGDAAGLGRSASGALLTEFRRSPRWCNLSPSQGSVSPSQRIHALAKKLTCKIRLTSTKTQPAAFIKTSQADPWSSTSSPVNLQDELHLSGPSSSNSDMDASSQTPVSEGAFSKSFSRVSYESFEHSFARRAAASNSPSQDDGLASPVASSTDEFKETFNSSPGSPYLGPIRGDNKESGEGSSSPVGGAAAEGITKVMVKTCHTGSPALRKNMAPQTSAHDMWAPTLASYFRCLEAATMISSKPAARVPAAITSSSSNSEQERCTTRASEATLQTRLPYTMANSASVEQNLLWKEYCESPHAADLHTKCLGVRFPAASFFVSRGKKLPSSESSCGAWSPRAGGNANASGEDGFRSPAYAATLELLSPSAELFRKKRRLVVGFTSRGIKLTMPSTRRRAQIMEAVSTSLKRALYKCAKRCCRKSSSPPPLNSTLARVPVYKFLLRMVEGD